MATITILKIIVPDVAKDILADDKFISTNISLRPWRAQLQKRFY